MLEAEVLEQENDEAPRTPGSGRSWIVPVALAVVGAAILLLPRQDAPAPDRPGVANPPPPTVRFIGLPWGLSDRTVDSPLRIAFSASQPVPEGRARLSQLWRLDLPTGELTPGPVVGEVLAIRAAPTTGRVAFLEDDHALYILDRFLASRPTWVDDGVTAFDYAADGTLVYAEVVRRTARTGRAVAAVRLGVVAPDGSSAETVRDRTIRRLNLRGYTVQGDRFVAWGVRGGREHVLAWEASSGELSPAPHLARRRRARSAAGSWELGARGVRWISRAIPSDPAHLAVAGDFAIWASDHAFTVAERDGGQSFLVELPARFPTPTGPVAASEGT